MPTDTLPARKNVKILLVEDEPIVSLAQSEELREQGYDVETASSGEAAVAFVEQDPEIDIILMDIDLGRGINGVSAARRILQTQSLPILFLTAHAEPEVVATVRDVTRYGYVLKSSGIFVLSQSITMALERFDQERSLKRANQALLAVSEFNRRLALIERPQPELSLLRDMCRVVVDFGGFDYAWIGLPITDSESSIQLVASHGNDELTENLNNHEQPEVRVELDRVQTVLETGRTLIEDSRRESLVGFGYRSSAYFPFVEQATIWGCLAIYSSHGDSFEEEARILLEELARSISYGIRALRIRRDRSTAYREAALRRDQLTERLSELQCIYQVSELLANTGEPIDLVIPRIVEIATNAFVHRGECAVRITCGTQEFTDGRFRPDRSVVAASTDSGAHTSVTIELACLNVHPEAEISLIRDAEKKLLRNIADRIATYLDTKQRTEAYRATRAELDETHARLESALSGSRAGIWEWHIPTGITTTDERWAEMLGYTLSEIEPITSKVFEKFAHPDDLVRANEAMDEHLRGTRSVYSAEVRMRHKVGDWIWVYAQGRIVERSASGEPIRVAGTTVDITEIKTEQAIVSEQREKVEALLKEKDLLLREVNHRVKNDLALIRSLFSLQATSSSSHDTQVALAEAGRRVAAIAEIYDGIQIGDDEGSILLEPLVRNIADKSAIGKALGDIETTIDFEAIAVSRRLAMSIGLIVNELITNSLKYGESEDGIVRLEISARFRNSREIEIVVGDRGSGYQPETYLGGFGNVVVDTLVRQYKGSVNRENHGGASTTILFPCRNGC